MNGTKRIAVAALVVAAISLAANGWLLWQLRDPERLASDWLAARGGPDATLRTTIRLPAGTPLALDVPVDEQVRIRVDTVFPLNTTVGLPIRTPVGPRTIRVPLRAQIPLRAAIPLRLRHTFRLRTRTPQAIEFPLEIPLRELRIGDRPLLQAPPALDPP